MGANRAALTVQTRSTSYSRGTNERGPASQPSSEEPRLDCQHPEYSICGQRLDRVTIINVVDVPPKKDILLNLPTSIQASPLSSANGWVEAQMPELLKAMADLQSVLSQISPDGIESERCPFLGAQILTFKKTGPDFACHCFGRALKIFSGPVQRRVCFAGTIRRHIYWYIRLIFARQRNLCHIARGQGFVLDDDANVSFTAAESFDQPQASELSSQRTDLDRSTGRFVAGGDRFFGVSTSGGPTG
jgi:hypothetical protein